MTAHSCGHFFLQNLRWFWRSSDHFFTDRLYGHCMCPTSWIFGICDQMDMLINTKYVRHMTLQTYMYIYYIDMNHMISILPFDKLHGNITGELPNGWKIICTHDKWRIWRNRLMWWSIFIYRNPQVSFLSLFPISLLGVTCTSEVQTHSWTFCQKLIWVLWFPLIKIRIFFAHHLWPPER